MYRYIHAVSRPHSRQKSRLLSYFTTKKAGVGVATTVPSWCLGHMAGWHYVIKKDLMLYKGNGWWMGEGRFVNSRINKTFLLTPWLEYKQWCLTISPHTACCCIYTTTQPHSWGQSDVGLLSTRGLIKDSPKLWHKNRSLTRLLTKIPVLFSSIVWRNYWIPKYGPVSKLT